ncbi:hypothetical protein Tsubulata_018571 [Turnera subulata]|uniref:Uncharacterized protein n=1 Tax=Turnera subulata TaxID=218843 RepID=A0A9Q0G4T7_9ROSI|nr:hypothetical protein Tsubulata_018571 [Turnera subulata]
MEVQCILQSSRDWNSNHVTEYEGYYNHDEDTFYRQLKRQILLLTADEDEDFPVTTRLNNSDSSSSTHKGLSSVIAPAAGSYFSLYGIEHSTNSVPTWLVNLWRKGNGTGVFIPQVVNSRTRRIRPGKP